MENATNPFGLQTVTPYLIADDVQGVVDFLQTVFGAQTRGDIRYREDTSIQHVELTIGDSVIMLGSPVGDFTPTKSSMYTYVEDCDMTYGKAIEYGAESVLEPVVFSAWRPLRWSAR